LTSLESNQAYIHIACELEANNTITFTTIMLFLHPNSPHPPFKDLYNLMTTNTNLEAPYQLFDLS